METYIILTCIFIWLQNTYAEIFTYALCIFCSLGRIMQRWHKKYHHSSKKSKVIKQLSYQLKSSTCIQMYLKIPSSVKLMQVIYSQTIYLRRLSSAGFCNECCLQHQISCPNWHTVLNIYTAPNTAMYNVQVFSSIILHHVRNFTKTWDSTVYELWYIKLLVSWYSSQINL